MGALDGGGDWRRLGGPRAAIVATVAVLAMSCSGDIGGARTDAAVPDAPGTDAPSSDGHEPEAGDGDAGRADGAADGPSPDGPPPTACHNGAHDGHETDTDCGGGGCCPCADGRACGDGRDCASGVCLGGTCAAGQTYYVSTAGDDGADGSSAHPWQTIQHAAESVGPGATVVVAAGTYPEAVTAGVSGTAAQRVRFVAEVRWAATVAPAGQYTTWTNTGDYVDIVGFEITSDGCLGLFNEGSFTRVIGNHVHHVTAPHALCGGNGGAGIDNGNYGASDADIVGNVVHHVGDYQNPGSNIHGLYHSILRGIVANNLTYRNEGWGIHTWHAAQYVTIVNNTVFANGYGGIIIGDGDSPGGVVNDYTLVANNIVVHNGGPGYGIYEYGATGVHNRYLNNLVYQNAPGDIRLLNGLADQATVVEDPAFIDYQPDATGDYHLAPGSPAIDTGTSDSAPAFDLDGAERPVGGAWDIGAYEAGAPAPSSWCW